jgi:hypothetical protein
MDQEPKRLITLAEIEQVLTEQERQQEAEIAELAKLLHKRDDDDPAAEGPFGGDREPRNIPPGLGSGAIELSIKREYTEE